jgi:hypothetical protein
MPDDDLATADAKALARMRATLRCVQCGSADIVAVAPGTEAERMQNWTVARERPMVAWCRKCVNQRYLTVS